MARALLVSVRFHDGRYHGAGDWPPAPGRLFQALVAGAARGATAPRATLDALEWLERLPPPAIAAPRETRGQPVTLYVPNNDLDARLGAKATPTLERAAAAIRVPKTNRPILFDASAPTLYLWSVDGDGGEARAAALREAARGLYRLGRGMDMAWAEAELVDAEEAERRLADQGGVVWRPAAAAGSGGERDLLCPRPGTLESLAARFDGFRGRFRAGGTNRKPVRVFAQPPRALLAKVPYDAPPVSFHFDLRAGDGSGFAPRPLAEAGALVAEVRDEAAGRLRAAAPELAAGIDRFLVGKGAGDADKASRVRILPIPSVGREHADMAIRRLAVHVPRSCPLRADDLAWAFGQVAWIDGNTGEIRAELQRAGSGDRMFGRYERAGRRWRSVTPLALPERAARRRIDPARPAGDAKGAPERAAEEARAAAAIVQALRHAGARTRAAEIRVRREPFHPRGERAEAFAGGTRFPARRLWHAEIEFAEPVRGPLALGDGRFLGLGLMLAEERAPDILAFDILDGLAEGADPAEVARAARRAAMARFQAAIGPRASLPAYVSGHAGDGGPAGGGAHRHIAVAADLAAPRPRVLFIAPWRLWRGGDGAPDRETRRVHERLAGALAGMDTLRAGAVGLLALAPAALDEASDPLLAPAREWESATAYRPARHARGLSDAESLAADVRAELRRAGRPKPAAVEILAVRRGPGGGLSGRLRLVFARAEPGPLALGRAAHKGGGLFAARAR